MKTMKYSPYSFSRMSSHESCPRKFKYTYIDKVQIPEEPQEALIKGFCAHLVLEHYPNFPQKELDEIHNSDIELNFKNKGIKIAENFKSMSLAKSSLELKGIAEYEFGLTEDFQVCDYNDPEAMFRGSIDRIVTNDNNNNNKKELNIIDWKSGKAKEQRWQSYSQLSYYALFVLTKYPLDEVTIRYIYIEHDLENPLTIKRTGYKYLKDEFYNKILKIEQDTQFKKNVTKLCDWCKFKQHCEADNG